MLEWERVGYPTCTLHDAPPPRSKQLLPPFGASALVDEGGGGTLMIVGLGIVVGGCSASDSSRVVGSFPCYRLP